jgi:hypothetical protein|tara:strand:+ start:185 stop:406 length:222 start_codon:yes stop_codon:yes gene_type:complete
MKIALALILCSYVADSCLPPHVYPLEFDTNYECLMVGYSESIKKIEEIGPEEINKYQMYIKFGCYEILNEQDT